MKELRCALRDVPSRAVEADIEAVVHALFRRWPALVGFSVRDAEHDDGELFLAHVEAYPWPSEYDGELLRREIAQALFELLDEAPVARELLRARTFARTWH